MFKNLIRLYSLCVLLLASVIIICSAASFLQNIIAFSLPNYKYANELREFSSNSRYIEHFKKDNSTTYDPTIITNERIEALSNQVMVYKNQAIAGMLDNLSWLLVAFFATWVHIYIYKKNPNID